MLIKKRERECGGSLFYTSVTGHSMGQIILVRKNIPFDVQCIFKNDRILTVRVMLVIMKCMLPMYTPQLYPAKRELSVIIYMSI